MVPVGHHDDVDDIDRLVEGDMLNWAADLGRPGPWRFRLTLKDSSPTTPPSPTMPKSQRDRPVLQNHLPHAPCLLNYSPTLHLGECD